MQFYTEFAVMKTSSAQFWSKYVLLMLVFMQTCLENKNVLKLR